MKNQRWFIWTIVFLVVSGVSLVSYITYTSNTAAENDPVSWVVHHPKQTQTQKTPVKRSVTQ